MFELRYSDGRRYGRATAVSKASRQMTDDLGTGSTIVDDGTGRVVYRASGHHAATRAGDDPTVCDTCRWPVIPQADSQVGTLGEFVAQSLTVMHRDNARIAS